MSGFHLQEQLAAEGMGMPVVPGAASVSKTPGPPATCGSPSTNMRCSTPSVGQSR